MEAGEATTATTRTASEDRQIPPAPRHLTIQPAQMTAALAIAKIRMARTNPTALPPPPAPPRNLGQARSLVRSLLHREFAGLLAPPTSIRPASLSYAASLVAVRHCFNPATARHDGSRTCYGNQSKIQAKVQPGPRRFCSRTAVASARQVGRILFRRSEPVADELEQVVIRPDGGPLRSPHQAMEAADPTDATSCRSDWRAESPQSGGMPRIRMWNSR